MPVRRVPVPIPAPMCDDWEDDDDETDQAQPQLSTTQNTGFPSITTATSPNSEEENKRIWDNANLHVPTPMPTLILSPSAMSPAPPPPPGAFQPAMRILKRAAGTQNPPKTVTSPVGESIQEREERYAKARVRIFGDEPEASTKNGGDKDKSNRKQSGVQSSQVRVVRSPKGPPQTNGGVQSSNPGGFGERSGLPPPPTSKT